MRAQTLTRSLTRSIHMFDDRSTEDDGRTAHRASARAPGIRISIPINNTYVPFCIPQIETSQPINLFQKISIFNAINTIYIFFFIIIIIVNSFFLSSHTIHAILHAEEMIATPSTLDTSAAAAVAATWAGSAGWRAKQLGHICCWYLSSL